MSRPRLVSFDVVVLVRRGAEDSIPLVSAVRDGLEAVEDDVRRVAVGGFRKTFEVVDSAEGDALVTQAANRLLSVAKASADLLVSAK